MSRSAGEPLVRHVMKATYVDKRWDAVEKYFLDISASSERQRLSVMNPCAPDLLSAASYLCRAADDLRAAGLTVFAAEIDSLLATLDAELALAEGVPYLNE